MSDKVTRRALPAPGDRYAAILEAATDLFFRDGAGATVDEIARRAGVSKPVLYESFSNKEALLGAICFAGMRPLHIAVAEALSEGGEAPIQLQRMARSATDAFQQRFREISVFLNAHHELSKADRAKLSLLRRRSETLVLRLIEQGLSDGVFNTDDPQGSVHAIMGSIFWIVSAARRERWPAARMRRLIDTNVLRLAGYADEH